MADRAYPEAPRLRNELVNRHSLSSSAAAGRRSLIEAMLTHGSEERLAIGGYPPEASMYECILRASGLHRENEHGEWVSAPRPPDDPARLGKAWGTLSGRCSPTRLGRVL